MIELFGHQRMAGVVSEQTIGGASFVRVDVPETATQPKFTRLLNPSAIYAINPISQEVMESLAKSMNKKPIDVWDIRDVIAKQKLALEEKPDRDFNDEDED